MLQLRYPQAYKRSLAEPTVSQLMIIDFTKFATPTRAINLVNWTNIDNVDVDLAVSKRHLVNPGAKAEYFLEDVKLEGIISPEYPSATHAAILRATVRENDTLQIFHTLSFLARGNLSSIRI